MAQAAGRELRTRLVIPTIIAALWLTRAVAADEPQITNSLGMKLVRIAPGTFIMGSPKEEAGRDIDEEQHEVQITRPFYLGKHELTVGQFRVFVRDTSYLTEPERDGQGGSAYTEQDGMWTFVGRKPAYNWSETGFPRTDDHPVSNVSWNDAIAFCDWLSRKEGRKYRLPTEAEWEYSCRAGTTTRYYNGDREVELAAVANIADLSGKRKLPAWKTAIAYDDGFPFTASVGQFQANAWGLHDMHGSLWEWCAEWYDANDYQQSPRDDPQGPASGTLRVARSGCWNEGSRTCRSADRSKSPPSYRSSGVGFRVVIEP
jgi:formylglycine-generating enzyme required for sulfatase activity